MTDDDLWRGRVEDYARHVADLRHRSYEGASGREDKEATFLRAFDFATPLALRVLEDVSDWYLCGSGTTTVNQPVRDQGGGLVGSWAVSWPLLEADRHRVTDEKLSPVRICAIFPIEWTHPHLALLSAGEPVFTWPFQVASPNDATRQGPVLRVIAEAELHDRIYCACSNWAVLPEGFGSGVV